MSVSRSANSNVVIVVVELVLLSVSDSRSSQVALLLDSSQRVGNKISPSHWWYVLAASHIFREHKRLFCQKNFTI